MIDDKNSRERILARVRAGKPEACQRPEVAVYPFPGDAVDNFKSKLKFFSGDFIEFGNREDIITWLGKRLAPGEKVYSHVSDFPAEYSVKDFEDPRDAHILDAAVVESRLGVGETGSVWLPQSALGVPGAALLCRDLYVILRRADIVDGISEAYRRIELGKDNYASFFTGPSATADIEAIHVTGAQGEISLTVLLY